MNTSMILPSYDDFPTEILGLIESYLPPSACAHLSATSKSLHRRWTSRRWYRTFQLHYGWKDQARFQKRSEELKSSRREFVKLLRLHKEQRLRHQMTFYWDSSEREILSDGNNSNNNNNKNTSTSSLLIPSSSSSTIVSKIHAAYSKYNECYRDGWEYTFVGCCHDDDDDQGLQLLPPSNSRTCCIESVGSNSSHHFKPTGEDAVLGETSLVGNKGECIVESRLLPEQEPPPQRRLLNNRSSCGGDFAVENTDHDCAITTRFNVTALVPSVKRLYVDLWDTIELSLLGYYDAAADDEEPHMIHDQYPVPAIMRILRTCVLPDLFEYLYFMVGLKPLAMKSSSANSISAARRRRRGGGALGPMLSRRLFGGRLGSKLPQPQSQQQFHAKSAAQASTSSSSTSSSLIARPSFGYALRGITTTTLQEYLMDSSSAQVHGSTTTTTAFDDITSLSDAASTMSSWKLACFLQQRGVGCLRCEICNCIDLTGDEVDVVGCDGSTGDERNGSGTDESDDEFLHDDDVAGTRYHSFHIQPEVSGRSTLLQEFHKKIGGCGTWIAPCQCRDPVHRECLERKLNLVTKYEPWERFKLAFGRLRSILTRAKVVHSNESTTIAPKVWISYDNTIPVGWGWRHRADNPNIEEENSVAAVDDMGRFRSPSASCDRCGGRFVRTVRLPRSRWEVLTASLSDPISMMRAVSTFIHFVFACAFLAACEGMCTDASCSSHRILLSTPLGVLKWPTTGLNGLALAWWQLQQCCMLHIFFSRRFAAIVDRLWMGPIAFFYFRLYFYFIVTSALLTASYIPMVSRSIRINLLESWIAPWILELLQPVGNAIALANLFQYAFVSTTVICIFWRTNYRMFTVADGKEAAAILRRRGEGLRGVDNPDETMARQNEAWHDVAHDGDPDFHLRHRPWVAGDRVNAANHPMYHGPW